MYLLYDAFSWSSENKNDLRFYLAQIVYSVARNSLSLMKELVIRVSAVHCSRLVNFSSRKSSVHRHKEVRRLCQPCHSDFSLLI